jgi:sarcinarray family protein
MISKTLFSVLVISCGLIIVPCVSAGSCNYGTAEAWIRVGDGPWKLATQHPILHPGDTFEILVKIRASTWVSAVFCELHEFGTPVYDSLEGPSEINELLSRGVTKPQEEIWYLWQIRVSPQTKWLNGSAPLEVFIQFTLSDDDSQTITFDALCGYIEMRHSKIGILEGSDIGVLRPFEPLPIVLALALVLCSIASHLKGMKKKDSSSSMECGDERAEER